MTCIVLARWAPGYTDPWLVLTDLPPAEADVAWYGLRAWIECSYKDMKRGDWHWEQTRMTAPTRAERLWLAWALATLLVVNVGVPAEATAPPPVVEALPPTPIAWQRTGDQLPPRAISCFQRGRLLVLAAFACGRPQPAGVTGYRRDAGAHVARCGAIPPSVGAALVAAPPGPYTVPPPPARRGDRVPA